MAKFLELDKGTEAGIRELLGQSLRNGQVKAVFALRRTTNGAVNYSLITDPQMMEEAVPLFPSMPSNAGQLLSRLTLKGPVEGPVAVVVRPCELRALVELVKREQGSLEGFLFISFTCPGVYPLKASANGEIEGKQTQYWEAVKSGKVVPEIRPTCRACEHFIPYNADITISLVGNKDVDKRCILFLNTAKGAELVKGVGGKLSEGELETAELHAHREERLAEKKSLYDQGQLSGLGMDGLIEIFSRCIGCRGCRSACPICYCNLCTFDSFDYEYEPSTYEEELKKRGGVRIPPNTIFYHLGRLTHVGISCVGCGSCTDVCPVDIPLSAIFLQVGEAVQKIFDYIPGKDVEEDVPLATFEEVELTEIEE